MVNSILESAALAPRDPSLDFNTDEWPEFDLTNVSVHLPNSQDSMTSLLLATERYPLTVQGQLEPSHDNIHLLLEPTTQRKRIKLEIPDVRTFSYGQYQNGTIALWAAGSAGWYSIRPSRSYKPIFQEMTEAVNVFYFIVDAYREPRKSGRGRNITLLPPYTAQELFEKYATDVLEEPTELGEAADRLYQHRDFLLSSMIAGKEGMTWSHNPFFLHLSRRFSTEFTSIKKRLNGTRTRSSDAQKQGRNEAVEENSSVGTRKRKRGRPTSATSKNSESVESDLVAEAETDEGAKVEGALEELQLARQQAPPSNAGRRTRNHQYTETPADANVVPPKGDLSDDGGGGKKTQAHRKRKSLLRLRPSTASKSASRSGKAPVPETESPDNDTTPSPIENGPSPTTDATSRRSSKRQSRSAHEDEGIDMADSHSEEEPTVLAVLPVKGGRGKELGNLPLDHRSEPVQGEDTWVCALDGCRHKIYAASTPESQGLIREHYVSHAYDDDERVQLVKRLQAPSLPVRHLMERVRQQAKVEGFPGSRLAGTRYPSTVPPVGVAQR